MTLSLAKTQGSQSLAKTQGSVYVRVNQQFVFNYFILYTGKIKTDRNGQSGSTLK